MWRVHLHKNIDVSSSTYHVGTASDYLNRCKSYTRRKYMYGASLVCGGVSVSHASRGPARASVCNVDTRNDRN